MKNLEELELQIADYAKDVKINLQSIISEQNQALSVKQTFGAALAAAYAIKEKTLINILENEAKNFLSELEINAVKTASILMAMNNIYYRFTHLTSDNEYAQMPVGLRMRGILDHKIDKVDFEIFSLSVSIVNGCGACVDAHANQIIKHGLSKTQVQMVAKIAALINATALTIFIG